MKKHRATSSASAANGNARPQSPTASEQNTARLFYTHDHPWRTKSLSETRNRLEFEAVRSYEAITACNKNSPELEALITKGIEEELPFVATSNELKRFAKNGNKVVQDFLRTASIGLKNTLGIGGPPRTSVIPAPQHNYQ
jgi:hypothetical protein